jgi:Arc/MetJ family transcription regulator
MRTTVVLDDELVATAMELTGISERSALLRKALTDMISREAALRLSALRGAAPDAVAPPRRRFGAEDEVGGP